VVLIDYNREERVINRTALRKALSYDIADNEIKKFLANAGETSRRIRSPLKYKARTPHSSSTDLSDATSEDSSINNTPARGFKSLVSNGRYS